MHAQEMISTHPQGGNTNDELIRCIEECYSCAQTCTACADAYLGEDKVKDLTQCIRLNLDCAEFATSQVGMGRAGRAPTRKSSGECWTLALRRAVSAQKNAKSTPACMSIAGSAPSRAGVA